MTAVGEVVQIGHSRHLFLWGSTISMETPPLGPGRQTLSWASTLEKAFTLRFSLEIVRTFGFFPPEK